MTSEALVMAIVECLRFYSEGLNEEVKKHKRITLFPQNLGPEKWSPNHGSTRPFKEPGKLRLEGAESALKVMADHIQECFEKGVLQ